MSKTLPSEHLDVGASEKTIQFLLAYSQSLAAVKGKHMPSEELELIHQN